MPEVHSCALVREVDRRLLGVLVLGVLLVVEEVEAISTFLSVQVEAAQYLLERADYQWAAGHPQSKDEYLEWLSNEREVGEEGWVLQWVY